VHRLDGLFGDVLAAIGAHGLREESVITLTADHGEVLHREGAEFHWNHGFALAPEVLGVPWILSAPGVAAGAYAGVTRSIDVFPTLAGLAGVSLPEGSAAGVDLAPVLFGRAPPPELLGFSHTAIVPGVLLQESHRRGGTRLDALQPARDPELMWVSVRDGDRVYKLTAPGGVFQPALYDLAADPRESRNLYDPTDPRQRAVIARLGQYKAGLVRRFREGERERTSIPKADELDMLRQLGYVD
jgi:arylsulfatase A-like enzyme